MLFFVCEDSDKGEYEANRREVWNHLEKAVERVRVVLAMVKGDQKPKPRYLGAWGVIWP